MKKLYPFLFIALIFLGLFILSKPYRQSELSRENTAHIFMLTSLELFQQEGIAHYHFAAVQTFQEADSLKKHYYARLVDANNNNYYVSHPPLAFIANHYIIKILGLNISDRTLKNIAFILLLLGALMIYFTARLSTHSKTEVWSIFGALVAMAVYAFNPVNLYAHIYHNFSEIWGQFFLISSLLSMLMFFRSNNTRLSLILFGISVFALTYTDWMGFTFLVAAALLFIKDRRKKYIKRLIFTGFIGVIAAATLTFWQYYSIGGFEALYRAIGIRFVERSGFFGQQYTDMGYSWFNSETWLLFLMQIHNVLMGPGYIVIALVLIKFIFFRKEKFSYGKSMWIALLSAGLFALAVFSATASHYIYMARFTPFLALLAANITVNTLEITKYKKLLISILILVLPISLFLSMRELKSRAIQPDNKQIILDEMAKEIQETGQHELKLSSDLEERDIIFLSYKAKMNLVWINRDAD